METVQFADLDLDAVEQDADGARWSAGFPFSPDRPGETSTESTDYTVVYNEIEPQNHIGRHRDAVDELLFVLGGTVEAEVGSETTVVNAGTLAVLPAGTGHSVRNVGSRTARMVGVFPTAPVESVFEQSPTVTDDT